MNIRTYQREGVKPVSQKSPHAAELRAGIKPVDGPNGSDPPFSGYGLLGEVTEFIKPQTEADPWAIYLQLIVAFGNYIDRKAFFEIEATKHHTNLFANIVGDSSISRKGTSGNYAKKIFAEVDPLYGAQCVDGLSSGEGLIWHLRDDLAVLDKRCLVIETEFARVLKVMSRANNTLSMVPRAAWDGGGLHVMTRQHAARSTNPHISIVGHITEEELRREMGDADVFNGFANRFLWLSVSRAQILPQGGITDQERLAHYVEQVRKVCKQATQIEEMTRDAEAKEHWESIYGELTSGHSGLLGAATNRAAPQVVRLSLIFALSDGSPIIKLQHQRAALALGSRCFQSALKFFGHRIQNKHAQRIFDGLKERREGMTRTEISVQIFKRNVSANQLNDALVELENLKLVDCEIEPTGGRAAERWFVKLVGDS
jgi:hypothetical protein